MRRHRFGVCLSVAMLVVSVLSVGLVSAQELYRSNAAGMRLERIPRSSMSLHRYVVEYERREGLETERFFEDGKLLREFRRAAGPGTTVREEEYSGEALVAVRLLDAEGRDVSEELYSDGELSERREYRYRDGRVVRRLVFNSEGEQYRSDEYRYGSGGALSQVRSVDADGVGRTAYYAALDGRLIEEYHELPQLSIRVRYLRNGLPSDRTEFRNNELSLSVLYEYDAAHESTLTATRETDHERGTETVRRYNLDGEIAEEAVYQDGRLQTGFQYSYDEGLLVERRGIGRAAAELETYEYDEEGELLLVRFLSGGVVRRERSYLDNGAYTDLLYRGGEAVLRTHYSDDRRIREEVIRDGLVVRTREFE